MSFLTFVVDEELVLRNRRMRRSGKGWLASCFEVTGKVYEHTNTTPATATARKMATQVVGGIRTSESSILSSDQLLLSMMDACNVCSRGWVLIAERDFYFSPWKSNALPLKGAINLFVTTD